MSEQTIFKCSKCGSVKFQRKNVRLVGSAGMLNPLEAEAYICEACGHIEFYRR